MKLLIKEGQSVFKFNTVSQELSKVIPTELDGKKVISNDSEKSIYIVALNQKNAIRKLTNLLNKFKSNLK